MSGAADTDRLPRVLSRGLSPLPAVKAALLFGSRATGRARPESDIDLAVLLDSVSPGDDSYVAMRQIWRALATEIAVERLDLVLLQRAPPVLAFRILRDGIVLFDRDPKALHRFRVETYSRYADFAPTETLFRQAIRRRAQTAAMGPGASTRG